VFSYNHKLYNIIWALPEKVESELRQVCVITPLELFGGNIAQRRMAALAIIETHNVGKDVGLGFLTGLVILEMDVLAFESAKEALHGSVVIAVADAAHADLYLLVDEKSLVSIAGILAATI
jgi:hypothetical protein